MKINQATKIHSILENNNIPIVGVSYTDSDNITISYSDDATNEQKDQANNILTLLIPIIKIETDINIPLAINWSNLDSQYLQIRKSVGTSIISTCGSDYSNWSNLTTDQKILASMFGIGSYALRTASIGDSLDEYYFGQLIEKSAGIKRSQLTGRKRVIEEMRYFVGLNYLRKELITKNDIDEFYFSCGDLLNYYINSNSQLFKNWLNGSDFSSKSYFSTGLRDALLNIYNLNY